MSSDLASNDLTCCNNDLLSVIIILQIVILINRNKSLFNSNKD